MFVLVGVVAVLFCFYGSAATNLSFAIWINEPTEIQKTEAMFREYEKANPGISVTLFQQPYSGYHERIQVMAAAGIAPDLITTDRMYVPAFAESGLIQPLDALVKADPDLDLQKDVTESVSGTYLGRFYGIPIRGGPSVMAYNVAAFEEAGLVSPVKMVAANNWTWDSFVDVGKKLTIDRTGDGVPDRFAVTRTGTHIPTWASRIWQAGGRVLGDDGKTVLIDQPEAIRGLEYLVSLTWDHHIAPQPGEGADFKNETAVMTQVWVSESINLANSLNFEMDLVMLPAGPKGYFHTAGGNPVAVSSTTSHLREAYHLAKWFAMDSGTRGLPASVRVLQRDYLPMLGQYVASPEQVALALQHPTRMEPKVHPKGPELEAAWVPPLQSAFEGRVSVHEAVANLGSVLRAILSR